MDDGDQDARPRAIACQLVGDDRTALTAWLRQVRGRVPANGPEQRHLDAALTVADMAMRTLLQIGTGEAPGRESTHLAESASTGCHGRRFGRGRVTRLADSGPTA